MTNLSQLADAVEKAEGDADMSWFLIAVRRGGRDVIILDHAEGWSDFGIEFYWEDTFDCDPPRHLEPGAYRWVDFRIGYWCEDDAINVTGGRFEPYTPALRATGSSVEGEI